MSIAALLEAADYLERREREAEHGYAIVSVAAQPSQSTHKFKIKKLMKTRKNNNTRSTHNELEKNRRAHLRTCLERLRDEVPAGGDTSRHTTLGLLTRARDYIRSLEEKDRMNERYKDQLAREHRLLTERLSQLASSSWRTGKPRAKSNSCSSSASSCSSTSSGYATSEAADSEDLDSSTRSPPADLEGATCDLSYLAMTATATSSAVRASRRRLIK